MSNIVITTSNGFDIIRILNKLGMVEEIVSTFTEVSTIEQSRQREYVKIRNEFAKEGASDAELTEQEKVTLVEKIALEHPEIQETLNELTARQSKITGSLLMNGLMRLPQAEKEVDKVLASIYGITEKEVQNKGLDWMIDAVKEIVASQTFQTFFKLATK